MLSTQTNGGRVLIFDIETAPNLSYVWGHWDQNVVRHKHRWYVLCFAWAWLDELEAADNPEDAVNFARLDQFSQKNKRDDKGLTKLMRDLFEEADITVAHNGDRFDVTKMWSRFMVHKLTPPSRPYQVDTIKAAKAGRFNSNSLKELSDELDLTYQKMDHGLGFDLWEGCMADDPAMWAVMEEYNRFDVLALWELYGRLRPYMRRHPNMNTINGAGGEKRCARCQSDKLTRNGYEYTGVSRFQRWRCKTCGFSNNRTRLSFDDRNSRPEIVGR